MGLYINPSDMSKEDFLAHNGKAITQDEAAAHSAGHNGEYVVCLVDNGPFKAAGIADTNSERDVFMYPDRRPKWWFLVSKEALEPYMK